MFEDIDWRTVGNCVKAAHDRIEPDITIRMHGLRRICVDETSYRKGYAYITVVYDMDRNRVVWIHEGNGLEIFRLFCESLSADERKKIEIVAGDGAQWIDTCTKEYFPNATRCIDFFHVVEWANEKLDKVRTATAAKAVREYERRKQEFQKTETEAAEAEEAARQQRIAAEAELAAMPKRGRPSKRKQELFDFLASFTEAVQTETPEQQRATAEAELTRDRLNLMTGDWWENPTWGNAIVEMLKESRLTEADGRAIAGYLSSYVRETAGVLDVRDVQYSMEEGRLCFSCVIESDKGSANVQYEI